MRHLYYEKNYYTNEKMHGNSNNTAHAFLTIRIQFIITLSQLCNILLKYYWNKQILVSVNGIKRDKRQQEKYTKE